MNPDPTINCLFCQKPILQKHRRDKRFCNDECKDDYHNALKFTERQEIKDIQTKLRHNRKVLKKLLGDQTDLIVTRDALLKMGFEFDYHTHHIVSKLKGHEYIFCFNYGYRMTEKKEYKIIKGFK